MINRPMLLNLFKKASEPKAELSQGTSRTAYVYIAGFTEGGTISLNAAQFRLAKTQIENGEIDNIIAINTNFTRALVLSRRTKDIMEISIPKTTNPVDTSYDTYVQTSMTSSNFIFQQ